MLRILFLLALGSCALAADYIRGCYFTNWAQYRTGRAKYDPSDYISGKCTHIFFAFGWMTDDFKATNYDAQDVPTSWAGEGLYAKVNKLKDSDAGLKTLLSFGGWTFGVARFQNMAATAANRKSFIDSMILFVRQYNFDGIDVDWEYPTGTIAAFTTFISELRAAVDKEVVPAGKQKLLLSAAVACGKATIDGSYDIPAIAPLFDFINLMAYDFHGGWESVTGENAPLYARAADGDKTLNVDYSAKYWVQKGLPAAKLIIGVGTYGRGFTLANQASNGIGAAATGNSAATSFIQEAGHAAYFELCEMVAQGAVKSFDAESQVPYLNVGNQWFGYDDVQSVTAKMQWLKSNGYGGAFVWTLDEDDFNGQCSNGGGVKYPLISAIQSELGGGSSGSTAKPGTTAKPATTVKPATTKAGTTVKTTAGPTQAPSNSSSVRGCYFTNWAQYRQGRAKYVPENYVNGLCTHIFFAFGWMTDAFEATYYDQQDVPTSWAGEGLYARVNKLRDSDPGLKTLLSFGGWTFGVYRFEQMSQTTANRQKFINSAIKFVRQYGFDGIDVDWEFPRGTIDMFTNLIVDLRRAIDLETVPAGKKKLLLTAAVSSGKVYIDESYNVPAIAGELDFVNLMSYDFHGGWEAVTGENAPLYARAADGDKALNVDYAAKYWVQKGLPAKKLIMGIGTYGRGFTLANQANRGIGAAATGSSAPTTYLAEAGSAAYFELCELIAQGAVVSFDSESQVPYLSLGTQWFGYDDVQSVKAKLENVKANGYGGAFVWTLDEDDFNGQCSNGGGKKYPLIGTIAKELGNVVIA